MNVVGLVATTGFATVVLISVTADSAEAGGNVGIRWLTCGDLTMVEGESDDFRAHRSPQGSGGGSDGFFERWRARLRTTAVAPGTQDSDFSPNWDDGTKYDVDDDDPDGSVRYWDFRVSAADDSEVESAESFEVDYYNSRITHTRADSRTHSHNANAGNPTVCVVKIIDNDAEVDVSTPPGNLVAGDVIEFTARFGQAVDFSGTRTLEFVVGQDGSFATKSAGYVSGERTGTLTFAYTVQPGDFDLTGISVPADAIKGGGLENVATGATFTPRNQARTFANHRIDSSIVGVSLGLSKEYTPWGITVHADSGTLYVSGTKELMDGTGANTVLAYDSAAEQDGDYSRKASGDFGQKTGPLANEVRGIWLRPDSGLRLYHVFANNQEIIGYPVPSDYSLFPSTPGAKIHADESDSIQGIWVDLPSDQKRMYVVSRDDDSLRAYSYPGARASISHDDSSKIELHSDNAHPRGVWSDGTTIWTVDSSDDKLYAYVFTRGATRGNRDNTKDIELHRANDKPRGLWSDGHRFYVVDAAHSVFRYPYHEATPWWPTGLTAEAAGPHGIDLEWVAPVDVGSSAITGYKIESSTDSGATWITVVEDTASTSTTYSDEGLKPSTNYAFRVSAINTHGAGLASATAEATTRRNSAPECSAVGLFTASLTIPFSQVIPAGTCRDANSDPLVFTVTKADGTTRPSWLSASVANDGAVTLSGTPSGSAGFLSLKLTVTDPGNLSHSAPFAILIDDPDSDRPALEPPTVEAAIEDQAVEIGDVVNLSLSGTIDDPGSRALTWAVTKPSPAGDWLTFNSTALTLSGTVPDSMAQGDQFIVTVRATNTLNAYAEYSFTITSAGHDLEAVSPTVQTAITDQSAYIGVMVDLSASGTITDPEGRDLTWAVTKPAPAGDWLTFNSTALTLSGTVPDTMAQGDEFTVTVRATNTLNAYAEYSFTITSLGVDLAAAPPAVQTAITNRRVYIGDDLNLSLSGTITDPANQSLTWTVDKPTPAGDWLVWNATALTLIGTVPATMAQGQQFTVTVTATDPDNQSAQYSFTVTSLGELASDLPPTVVNAITDQSAYIGDVLNLSVDGTITDPANQSLTWTVDKPSPAGDWLTFNSAALTLSGTVPATMAQGEQFTVTVTATDPDPESAQYSFTVTSLGVEPVPPAVQTAITDQSAYIGVDLDLSLSGTITDPKGRDLTWAVDKPSPAGDWLTFNSAALTLTGTVPDTMAQGDQLAVTVRATNTVNLYAEYSFTITSQGVDLVAAPPAVQTAITNRRVYIGDDLNLSLSGTITDPANQSLTWTVDKPSPAGDWLVWNSAALTLSGTVPATMAQGQQFTVTVTATDPQNQSARYSFTVMSLGDRPVVIDPLIPATPTTFKVTSNKGVTTFTWSNVSVPQRAERVRYDVLVRALGAHDSGWTILIHSGYIIGTGDGGPLTVQRLPVGGTYEFALRSTAIADGHPFSSVYTNPVTHTVRGHNRPQNLTVSRPEGDTGPAELSWEAPERFPTNWILSPAMPVPSQNVDATVTSYIILRAHIPLDGPEPDPLTYTQVAVVSGATTTYTDDTLTETGIYWYRIQARSPRSPNEISDPSARYYISDPSARYYAFYVAGPATSA